MKRYIHYLLASTCALFWSTSKAQVCNIPMNVIIEEGFTNVTPEAASVLQSQLERVASNAKMDIAWNNAKYAITAKFDQIDRRIVGGAPAQIVNLFGVTVYIADVYNQKVFASEYMELKGVGTNDTKASIDAIRRLNTSNAKLSSFFEKTKKQIINYYDSQINNIIKEAESAANMQQYESALAMLACIPSCCNSYDKAMTAAKGYYLRYRDTYFHKLLNQAKALWAANPTVAGSKEAVSILSSIDPECSCYPEAQAVLSEIAKSVKSDVDYEVRRKHEDAVELEKLRIQAIAEIGKAHAANQPRTTIAFLGTGLGVTSQVNSNILQQNGNDDYMLNWYRIQPWIEESYIRL